MKNILLIIAFSLIGIQSQAQHSNFNQDSLMIRAGKSLERFTTQVYAGYTLLAAGTCLSVVAVQRAKQEERIPTQLFFGLCITIVGTGVIIASHDNVTRAGRLLRLAGGEKIVIPIRHRR